MHPHGNCVTRLIITSRSARKPEPPFDQRVARKFKRHFRAATPPHASAPSLAAIAAAPARSGSEPQPGGARQSAAWTCCVGWVRLKPQGFLGAKPSGRAAEESRGGTDSNGLAKKKKKKGCCTHVAPEATRDGVSQWGARPTARAGRLRNQPIRQPNRTFRGANGQARWGVGLQKVSDGGESFGSLPPGESRQ